MSAGLTTYNYFMSNYASSVNKSSRYDTHKKSELKGIYNSIVKINKDNPIYMFKKSQEATAMAVDIKESARELTNTMASIAKTDIRKIICLISVLHFLQIPMFWMLII